MLRSSAPYLSCISTQFYDPFSSFQPKQLFTFLYEPQSQVVINSIGVLSHRVIVIEEVALHFVLQCHLHRPHDYSILECVLLD